MPLPARDRGLSATGLAPAIEDGRAGMRAFGLLAILAFVLLLALAPLHLNVYWLRVLSTIFMYATLAQAINLIAGFTGYPAFGNVVFFGLGAYSTAIVMVKLGGGFPAGLAVAVLTSLVTVLAIGPLLLRLRGHYFAIVTVGLNETVKALVSNLTPWTGGGMGLSLPLPPWSPVESARIFYYLMFAVMVTALLLSAWFRISRLGFAARAIRDDEEKAEAMGLRTTMIKTMVWALSAILTASVGAIYAYWFSYVEPSAVFDMLIAIKFFVIFLLGGAATLLGPILAAFFVEYASTVLWSRLLDYHLGAFGIAIMVIALYMPDGVLRFARDRARLLEVLLRPRR